MLTLSLVTMVIMIYLSQLFITQVNIGRIIPAPCGEVSFEANGCK